MVCVSGFKCFNYFYLARFSFFFYSFFGARSKPASHTVFYRAIYFGITVPIQTVFVEVAGCARGHDILNCLMEGLKWIVLVN